MQTKLTEGNPFNIIIRFMLPLLLGNLVQQLYNTCDTILVGKFVGPEALAAVGSTGTIMFLFMGFANGMATGYTILTSQRFGNNDEKGTRVSVTNGVFLCLAMIVIMTILGLTIMRPLLTAMKTPSDIFEDAYTYISTIVIGIFAMMFNCYLSALLRAVGNSKAPLVIMFSSAVLNIGLDLLFIITFNWRVAGAAWATVISQLAAAIGSFVYIVHSVKPLVPKKEDWKTDSKTIRSELSLGVPVALQNAITASGTVVMQSAINSFGTIAVTAVTASNKLQDLLTQGMFTMGQVMSSYVGQNYGKGDTKRIREGIRAAMKIMIVYSIVVGIIIAIILKPGLKLFLESGIDVNIYYPMARINIYENLVCYVFLGMIFVYRSSMQACDRGVRAMSMGLIEFASRVFIGITAIHTGIFYIACAANPLAWVCAGVFGMIMCYRMIDQIERKKSLSL
ncbi:MAG: MATE family efflux transporter [Saccharofermentans sp.]|nr:MATE family efflux transporter [Saccharofermentans sp.]